MFTANSMNCLSEALAFSARNGTILAGDNPENLNPERRPLRRAGLTSSKWLNRISSSLTSSLESFDNAVALDIAMAGRIRFCTYGNRP